MPENPYNPVEQEAILLNAVWELIDGLVNYANFEKAHRTVDAELRFTTRDHVTLFIILLADFLSKPGRGVFNLPEPTGPMKTDHTFLFYLSRICQDPQLCSSSTCLETPVREFIDWLEEESSIENVWLPSIELKTDISVKRIMLLKICGDTAKHSFPRLEGNVTRIVKLLRTNGHEIDKGQGFQILLDLQEWFLDDVFVYHSSTIAELLNNIRWGMYEYLQPEFERSFESTGAEPYEYRFNPPKDFNHTLATSMYWQLMNKERQPPWFPRFAVTEWLKKRY